MLGVFFICGEAGEKDSMGLPDVVYRFVSSKITTKR